MDNAAAEAIRQYVVDRVSQVIDNHEPWHIRVTAVAVTAVQDFAPEVYGASVRDWYAQALRGKGHPGHERHDYATAVGFAVRDVIQEIVDEIGNDDVENLLKSLLDLGDSAQARLFGEHYLPESDDDVWGPGDDGDDSGDG